MSKRIIGLVFAAVIAAAMLSTDTFAYDMGKAGIFQTVSVGLRHSMAIKADGSLWAWGDNNRGQLGDGTTEDRTIPVKVMDDAASVSAGTNYTAAIKTDGSLWAWGTNSAGQLGTGEMDSDVHPIPIKIMDDVAAVSPSQWYALAVKTDMSLWIWGYIDVIPFDGRDLASSCLAPVKIMDNVTAVCADYNQITAIKTDGSLWVWWTNAGYGKANVIPTPIKIMDDVAAVSSGETSTMAIKTDGSLWVWQNDKLAKLGGGEAADRLVPVEVMDNVSSVSVSSSGALAVKIDGSLWAFELVMDGTALYIAGDVLTPVKVMDNVSAAATNYGSSAVVKTDGSVWVWGSYYKDTFIGDNAADGKLTYPMEIMDGAAQRFDDRSFSTSSPTSLRPVTATKTAAAVLINGKKAVLGAFNINGNNYFKLRDIAYALNSTNKQFEVSWDGAENAISLTSGQPYTPNGIEMISWYGGVSNTVSLAAGQPDNSNVNEMKRRRWGVVIPSLTTSKILLDGKQIALTAYNIGGNNYFKLRDIGQAFGFGVDWNGADNTIVIDTNKDYTPQ